MRVRFNTYSLRTRTFIYLFLIIAPIFVTSWFASVVAANETKAQVSRTLLQLAKQTHTTLERDIIGIDESTIKMIQEPLIQSVAGDLGESETERVQKYVALGKVVDKYGVGESFYYGLKYSLFLPVEDTSLFRFAPTFQQIEHGVFYVEPKESPWYRKAVELNGKAELQVMDHFGVTTTGKTLTFLRSVKDFSTDLRTSIGMIAATDLQIVLSNELKNIELPESSEIYISDSSNRILASKTNANMGEKVRIPADLINKNEGNAIVTLDHTDYVLVYNYSGNYHTKLIILTPVSIITSQETQTQRLIIFLTGIYICIVIVTAGLFIRSFLTPLRKLGSMVHSFVPGKELKISASAHRRDEIGQLTSSFVKMTRRLNEMIHDQYVMGIKQKETELSMLQQQINPHLLYNTLESIYWHGVAVGENEVAEMVKDLSKLMRIGLSQGKDLIPIHEEIQHAEAYIRLQEKRDKQRFNIRWHVGESCVHAMIPKITLQPLLENAILHGIGKMEDEGEITVQICRTDDRTIELTVEDNGYKPVNIERLNAIVHDHSPKTEGYGIRNVQQRIRLHFGHAYGLSYETRSGGGVIARLTIPAQKPAEEEGEETA